MDRHTRWEVVRTGGQLYVTARGTTVDTPIDQAPLG